MTQGLAGCTRQISVGHCLQVACLVLLGFVFPLTKLRWGLELIELIKMPSKLGLLAKSNDDMMSTTAEPHRALSIWYLDYPKALTRGSQQKGGQPELAAGQKLESASHQFVWFLLLPDKALEADSPDMMNFRTRGEDVQCSPQGAKTAKRSFNGHRKLHMRACALEVGQKRLLPLMYTGRAKKSQERTFNYKRLIMQNRRTFKFMQFVSVLVCTFLL